MNQLSKFIKIYNNVNNSYVWYHSTLKGLSTHILKYGLKRYSIPTLNEEIEPYIYVSKMPFITDKDFVTLSVDLTKLIMDDNFRNDSKNCFKDNLKDKFIWEDVLNKNILLDDWQLKICFDIPASWISMVKL